eukprot:TRINITY_DN5634_c0_g1_i2.p1 TRINITY_DN5634_c0_g1~~TRINITY_DN5634_c0_g1_i2.p1  ORF type:complete len:455 (+),score=60.99 TRINITY_DN5634_c0_g1_i2:165-1529(+)
MAETYQLICQRRCFATMPMVLRTLYSRPREVGASFSKLWISVRNKSRSLSNKDARGVIESLINEILTELPGSHSFTWTPLKGKEFNDRLAVIEHKLASNSYSDEIRKATKRMRIAALAAELRPKSLALLDIYKIAQISSRTAVTDDQVAFDALCDANDSLDKAVELVEIRKARGEIKTSPEPSETPQQLSFLTWNVDKSSPNLTERTDLMVKTVAIHNPDIICFQELTKESVGYMHQALHYLGFRDLRLSAAVNHYGYFNGVYSKYPLRSLPERKVPSEMQVCSVFIPGWPRLSIATAHLRAGADKYKAEERVQQANRVVDVLEQHEHVVFGGDVNMRHDEDVGLAPRLRDLGVRDVYSVFNQPEHCRYTWHSELNHNIRNNPDMRYGPKARFDQIWSRGCIRPIGLQLVGTQEYDVDGQPYHPSDHFGLIARFELEKVHETSNIENDSGYRDQ